MAAGLEFWLETLKRIKTAETNSFISQNVYKQRITVPNCMQNTPGVYEGIIANAYR